MLVHLLTHQPITGLGRNTADYQRWRGQIGPPRCVGVEQYVERHINAAVARAKPGQIMFTTSWETHGKIWRPPLDAIWLALQDELWSAYCFGLFVKDRMIRRPETWAATHGEFHCGPRAGEIIKGLTYFQV